MESSQTCSCPPQDRREASHRWRRRRRRRRSPLPPPQNWPLRPRTHRKFPLRSSSLLPLHLLLIKGRRSDCQRGHRQRRPKRFRAKKQLWMVLHWMTHECCFMVIGCYRLLWEVLQFLNIGRYRSKFDTDMILDISPPKKPNVTAFDWMMYGCCFMVIGCY